MPGKRADGNVVRSYAVPAELHAQAAKKAGREKTNLSAVIRTALERYVKRG